jgi:hypothetical protein
MYQDTKSTYKNQYPFYIPAMNRLRKNIGKQFHLQYPPKNQIPRNKLNKNMNNLYKDNHKPLKKEIKEDHRRWKDLPCS